MWTSHELGTRELKWISFSEKDCYDENGVLDTGFLVSNLLGGLFLFPDCKKCQDDIEFKGKSYPTHPLEELGKGQTLHPWVWIWEFRANHDGGGVDKVAGR